MSFSAVNTPPWLATTSGSVVGELSVTSFVLPAVSITLAVGMVTSPGLTITPCTVPQASGFARPAVSPAALTVVNERIRVQTAFAIPAVVGTLEVIRGGATSPADKAQGMAQGILETEHSLLPILWPGQPEETSQVLVCSAVGTGRALLRSDSKALTLHDIGRMVYALWGYDGITDLRTIEIGRERIVMWCNAAMQLIFSRAERLEYFNRDRIDVVVSSAAGAALPDDVQRVHGNASIGSRSLRPLGSKDEADNFATYYGGSEPIGFMVESIRTAGADSLAMTLYLAPAPSGNTTVKLDVTKNPPRFDAADLLGGVIIPLPHKWVETLFVPIVRKWASADGKMPGSLRQEQIAEINGQFETAKQILGLANISPETTQKGGEEQSA